MSKLAKIGFTEEQIDMLGAAERFCREKSPMEKVRALIEDEQGFDTDVWAEIGELGWLGIAIPEEYGGVGLSLTEVVPVAEQMGRRMMHSPFAATTLAAQAILIGGTEAQKADILPKIAQGAAATLALSETNGDWNLENIKAEAMPDEKGYRLSDTKTFVADLEAAQWVITTVQLTGTIALAVIPKAAIPETAIRREVIIDETKRSYELNLDNVLIGEAELMSADKTEIALGHILSPQICLAPQSSQAHVNPA